MWNIIRLFIIFLIGFTVGKIHQEYYPDQDDLAESYEDGFKDGLNLQLKKIRDE